MAIWSLRLSILSHQESNPFCTAFWTSCRRAYLWIGAASSPSRIIHTHYVIISTFCDQVEICSADWPLTHRALIGTKSEFSLWYVLWFWYNVEPSLEDLIQKVCSLQYPMAHVHHWSYEVQIMEPSPPHWPLVVRPLIGTLRKYLVQWAICVPDQLHSLQSWEVWSSWAICNQWESVLRWPSIGPHH